MLVELNRNYIECFQTNNHLSEVDHYIEKSFSWILNHNYIDVGMLCQSKPKIPFEPIFNG